MTQQRLEGRRNQGMETFIVGLMFIGWGVTCAVGCYAFLYGLQPAPIEPRDYSKEICGASIRITDHIVKHHETEEDCSCHIKPNSKHFICKACHERTGLSPVMLLMSTYQVFFGILGMISDCGIRIRMFGFTHSHFGRSALMTFVGSFAMALGAEFGPQHFTYISGVLNVVVGLLASFVWLFILRDRDNDYNTEFSESFIPNQQQHLHHPFIPATALNIPTRSYTSSGLERISNADESWVQSYPSSSNHTRLGSERDSSSIINEAELARERQLFREWEQHRNADQNNFFNSIPRSKTPDPVGPKNEVLTYAGALTPNPN